MNILNVYLWGMELGKLAYNQSSRQCYFSFNTDCKENRPDVSPLLFPVKGEASYPIAYGDDRRIYQNLPPFIADSLPDSWGNQLFEQWARKNKLSLHNISPLYKLMFIGKRGMGALEFEPAATDLEHTRPIDIEALHNLSLKVLSDRENISILPDEELTMQTLLSVGTSAGGRQMKAILAIDKDNGTIKSGQTDGLKGHDYYLLKFEDPLLPTSEIEMAYHDMAIDAGIQMEECRLMNVEGVSHFLTKRFDRKDGRKIHMQTLAAINPDANSYEHLFATCRSLNLADREIEEVFRRLVLNVMGNNTDDHNKNFSFLLEEGGKWKLSPAYDLTFIFNRFGTDAETDRCLSAAGKRHGISKEDLLEIGRQNGIRCPGRIIDEIARSLQKFPELADKYKIDPRWSNIIKSTLENRLTEFGYLTVNKEKQPLRGESGRIFSNIQISINKRGHYKLEVLIDGQPRHRFIRPNMKQYATFRMISFFELPADKQLSILEELFPID